MFCQSFGNTHNSDRSLHHARLGPSHMLFTLPNIDLVALRTQLPSRHKGPASPSRFLYPVSRSDSLHARTASYLHIAHHEHACLEVS